MLSKAQKWSICNKKFKCSLCHKEFTRKHDAKRHELVHTGEKPYDCSNCDKKFTRKHDAKRHKERFHNKEKPKNIKEDLVDTEIDNEDLTEVNVQNGLVIDLTEDDELCIKASKYNNEETCLICDMEFHTSVQALNHINKEHIDIMIEDEISSPLMSKKEIDKNPFSFSQPNSLQIDVESNHLNTSLEDTPIHIQSKHPTVKSKISFTENNPSDLVDKKIDNEDSIDVFETNTTNQAKYEVDLTEHTSEISLPLIPMTKNKGKTVKRLRNKMKIKCDFYPFCKNVFYSRKRFDKHMEKGCSLWMAEFIPE